MTTAIPERRVIDAAANRLPIGLNGAERPIRRLISRELGAGREFGNVSLSLTAVTSG
jgi:hypothetical protein